MGWAVGYDDEHDRWRGYGVPAYCDAKGCTTEIDRGMGWLCECRRHYVGNDTCINCGAKDDYACECGDYRPEHEYETDPLSYAIFVCGEHTCADVDEDSLPPEHPEWINHLLTDESWQQWRDENPFRVSQMKADAVVAAVAAQAKEAVSHDGP